jgi:DNA end-binding protein Ku
MWSGTISFGLVSIPIKMYTAVRDHTIRFHRLTEDGSCRLSTKLYCPETGKEYDFGKTARGYEVAPDQYVLLSDEELEALKPDRGRAIEIEDFVRQEEIDPVYYDRPYWLAPDERGTRPYALLVDAMTRAERVGVSRFVLRDKQHLAALRVVQGGLCLSTMKWPDEVTALEDVAQVAHAKVDDRQVDLALQLIEALTRPFEPARYVDTFHDELQELLDMKARGERIPTRAPAAKRPEVADLMDALKKSLGSAGATKPAAKKPAAARHATEGKGKGKGKGKATTTTTTTKAASARAKPRAKAAAKRAR